MEKRYAIGLDYGTLSVRALLLDMDSAEEVGTEVYEYPHGVLSGRLPDGTIIPEEYALAVPEDYLDGLNQVVKKLMETSQVAPESIKGIGLDVTSATVIPVTRDGIPVSQLPGFESHPHAYIKLWKHHGAKKYADRMKHIAEKRREDWLSLAGGKISCEMFIPKTLETQACDPEVYRQCSVFLEVGDWLAWYMTGECTRSACMAGCNSFYQRGIGYPSDDFFIEMNPEYEPVSRKYKGRFVTFGSCAGHLTEDAAGNMGLLPGIPVAASMVDSHASVVGVRADQVGDMTAVIGTSGCYLMNSHTGEGIPGIYSSTYEAHIPEMFGYEGGQSSVGECLNWFIENCVPGRYEEEARREGCSIHTLLQRKAKEIEPENCGLTALDWWNGVRSPLMRPELTGMIGGLTIHTKTEEIYRVLMESICFGARAIKDTFCDAGHPVERLFAAGGISIKSPVMMQLMADICGIEIQVSKSNQTSARGSAIMGAAVADGTKKSTRMLKDWIHRLGAEPAVVYHPDYQKRYIYEEKYHKYCKLADIFSSKKVEGEMEI